MKNALYLAVLAMIAKGNESIPDEEAAQCLTDVMTAFAGELAAAIFSVAPQFATAAAAAAGAKVPLDLHQREQIAESLCSLVASGSTGGSVESAGAELEKAISALNRRSAVG